jgi:hypothetical protein
VKAAFLKVNFSVYVLSSLVRAVNVFCGLEKLDYFVLDNITIGVTTVDICCFRGVTAHGKVLGFAINSNNGVLPDLAAHVGFTKCSHCWG